MKNGIDYDAYFINFYIRFMSLTLINTLLSIYLQLKYTYIKFCTFWLLKHIYTYLLFPKQIPFISKLPYDNVRCQDALIEF